MKINELLKSFEIFTTNEEKNLLETFNGLAPLSSFPERDQVIIAGLIRKSLISKVMQNGIVMVAKNDN